MQIARQFHGYRSKTGHAKRPEAELNQLQTSCTEHQGFKRTLPTKWNNRKQHRIAIGQTQAADLIVH
jgi:hypothetical protein